jgi:hypothetical protein
MPPYSLAGFDLTSHDLHNPLANSSPVLYINTVIVGQSPGIIVLVFLTQPGTPDTLSDYRALLS